LTAGISIAAAVLGIVLALAALLAIWLTRDTLTRQVDEMVSLTGRTLSATRRTIDVTGTTLDKAAGDLETITKMVGDLGGTMDDSTGLIESTGKLVGEDMVDFVNDTQVSLGSVEVSAQVVDDFLRIVSSIPFVGSRYRPAVPLQESVANVSESLAPLPDAFLKIQADLETASANAETLRGEMDTLGDQIEDIGQSVSEARQVVTEYESILASVQTRYDSFQARINRWMTIAYASLTTFLVWMVLSQIAALMQAIALFNNE
jgi:hypothetical protein